MDATSSEELGRVFDLVGVPLCLVAPDLRVLRGSDGLLRWLGLPAEQVVGRSLLDLLPSTRAVDRASWRRIEQGEAIELPDRADDVHGRELGWAGRLTPIPVAGGTDVLLEVREGERGAGGRAASAGNGAEGRECAGTARDDEEALVRVAAAVPGVLYRYELRADGVGRCPFASPAAKEVFGLMPEQVVDDIGPLFARVPPDDLRQLQASIAESARTLSRWHGEFRYEHPTRGQRWIEGWSVPRKQADLIVWYGYATDATERMRAHEALRVSEEHYRRFFQNLLELVGVHEVVRDPGGGVLDWIVRDVNERVRSLVGKSPAELIGRRFSELFPVEVLRAMTAPWPDVLATGQAVQYEFVLLGRVLWISVARLDAVTVAAVADDITDRKRAEDALRESDRRKSEFLAILSHELRNPLAPIRTAIDLLEHTPPGTERAIRAQAVIRRQAEHVARLVDDLLDVTRFSRGTIELRRACIDLRALVQRTCEDFRALFEARGITLRSDLPEAPVWVDADATRMAQVVGNLLHNAAKFSREGGSVALVLTVGDGKADLRVRDQGVGIPAELLARLFEPFVQADTSLARTRGGLGLGLALVKGLVELHGGSVSVRSEGADRGAEAEVQLPLAAAPGGRRAEAASPVLHRASILVIEDNVDAASTLATALEVEGHQVNVATDGRTGLERARELRPEIILCDIGLPDVDGYEIARQLRRDAAFQRTRIVAVSGYALPEDRRRALEAGFDAHVAKPAPLDVLLTSLRAG